MTITKCGTCGLIKATCERCNASWVPSAENPKRCAKCGSAYWNTPKGTNPRGRPKNINGSEVAPPPP